MSEEWVRDSDLIGSVSATKLRDEDEWPWQVVVTVAEAIREEPAESMLDQAVTEALSAVHGVQEVQHEDHEVWIVDGQPDGRALVTAAASAIERIRPQLEQAVDEASPDE